jgi:hypothetical protein
MSWKTMDTRKKLLATLGIVTGLVLAGALRSSLDNGSSVTPITAVTGQTVAPPSVNEIVNRHLAWADSQGQGDLAATVVPIRELFGEARRGSRKFAEEALSLTSKWKLAKDYVTNGDEQQAFLREQFAAHLFSPAALEAVVQSVVAGHVRHLDDVDSELLVRLQADLASVPNLQLSANVDRQAIQASLDSSIRQAISAVEAELGPGVGLELVSYVAGEVLTSATFSLAASSGILTAGAASGAVSFGVGLVVGLIVDAVISWVYDELFDPAGELTKTLNQTLDALEQLILTGDGSQPGLIQRLQDYGARRSQARNGAIRSVVLPEAAAGNSTLAF